MLRISALIVCAVPLVSALNVESNADPNGESEEFSRLARVEANEENTELRKVFADRAAKMKTTTASITAAAPKAKSASDRAVAEAAKAAATLETARKFMEKIEKDAYDTAKAAAKAEVASLEGAASARYQGHLDALAAKANAPSNAKAEAAAKAAKPYFDAELRTLAIVTNYNLKANELIAVAKQTVAFAHNIANKANILQANGDAEMANRLMIQAHGAIADAQLKEDTAKKIYSLARALNTSVPSYQNAAQQAAVHVLATHPGFLQKSVKKSLSPEMLMERSFDEVKSERERFEQTYGAK